MNKEDLRQQFELAALGCLDNQQYYEFIKQISEDEELKNEFAQYQKVAALIPFSLNIQQPPEDTKNKVVVGIKKIIKSKAKETKPVSQIPNEDKTEIVIEQNLTKKTEELLQTESNYTTSSFNETSTEIQSENVEENLTQIEGGKKILGDNEQEFSDQTEIKNKQLPDPDLKVNIDYSPAFKEEIIEEVTKRIRKTVQYQFEDFENKINKKNKSIKFLLLLITLLTLTLVASNIYQMFFISEKKVEIKKEIRTPAIDNPDTLSN